MPVRADVAGVAAVRAPLLGAATVRTLRAAATPVRVPETATDARTDAATDTAATGDPFWNARATPTRKSPSRDSAPDASNAERIWASPDALERPADAPDPAYATTTFPETSATP